MANPTLESSVWTLNSGVATCHYALVGALDGVQQRGAVVNTHTRTSQTDGFVCRAVVKLQRRVYCKLTAICILWRRQPFPVRRPATSGAAGPDAERRDGNPSVTHLAFLRDDGNWRYDTWLNALMPTNFSFAAPVLLNISSAKYVDRSARRERWPRHCQNHIHVLISLLNESNQTIYCAYLSTHLERKHTCRDKHYGSPVSIQSLVLLKHLNKNILPIIELIAQTPAYYTTKLQ